MKPKTRKEIEASILSFCDALDKSGTNSAFYKKLFENPDFTDEKLLRLIQKRVPIYMPHGSTVRINAYDAVEVARQYGHEIYQHLWITDPVTEQCSLTAVKHMVGEMPARRQTQMIEKKAGFAKHNRTIDKTTGQPVGRSKGSSFSFPQAAVMFAKGYDASLFELIVARGGNNKLRQAIDRNIRNTGRSNAKLPGSELTRVKSTVVLGAIFKAMHIGSTL